MAQGAHRIVQDLMGEPHIAGRRVSVLQLYEAVEGENRHPTEVADQLSLDAADVYSALAYYYEHRDEIEAVRARRDELEETLTREIEQERPEGVSPPE